MKLFVVGATGGIGSALVAQGLARGHRITAFVRSPEKLTVKDARLTAVKGDPCDAGQMAAALAGNDAVLSALGARSLRPDLICSAGARATVAAMARTGVRRLVIVSSALLFPDVGWVGGFLRDVVLKNPMADCRELEQVVTGSGLDWTIVRATRLTNGPLTNRSHAEINRLPGGRGSVTRPDVANFMLETVEQNAHGRTVVGLSGK